ncbi:response regulator transcription factor [Pedobacter frigoris]|uniref:Response regulator transcription factor n=1 Tax=Pedobacter frigoris TaxID=2571272 RepID=A0A4U1CM15_9SPHI|nr:response regulator transcription factor [Pedobacter frigoris]TKC08881.1 response regulator transcription factor [Pedobacter frigoris]
MLRIILAEDHKLVRDGVKMLLGTSDTLEVIAEAPNGQVVLDLLAGGTTADMVLADINMPVLDGKGLLDAINENYPKVKVVFLSMMENPAHIAQMIKAGACGYLLKNTGAEELIFALNHISAGERYICAEIGMNLLEQFGGDIKTADYKGAEFSARELEILHLIAEGYTNMEIADRLFISKRTVEGHRQSLLEKTESRNTATLIRSAVLQKLI